MVAWFSLLHIAREPAAPAAAGLRIRELPVAMPKG